MDKEILTQTELIYLNSHGISKGTRQCSGRKIFYCLMSFAEESPVLCFEHVFLNGKLNQSFSDSTMPIQH